MSEKIKILVVDDEEVVHASIQRILTRYGYEVIGVTSAHEGLDLMVREAFDALITDLMMPGMNGVKMLTEMKERQIETPAIMITGYPTIKTAVEALRLGAVDYIPKPFTRKELLNPLNRALRRTSEAKYWPEPDGEHPDAASPQPGDCYYLPGHAWAVYRQDGAMDVGVEASFLTVLPPVEEITLPSEKSLVEQGLASIRITGQGEDHCVFMPLSGQVVAINEPLTKKTAELDADTWLIRIVPSDLDKEIGLLKKRAGR